MEEYKLIKYLEGTLEADLCKEVEQWVSSSDENRKVLEDLYVLLFVNDRMSARKAINVEDAFKEFQQKYLPPAEIQIKKVKKTPMWRRVAGVAAIFVVAIASATILSMFLLDHNTQPVTVATKLGERAHVELPDGSKVWLNACSNLEYNKSLLSRKRIARLKGEAYFEVAHNSKMPFIVSTGDTRIRVLGTKFNVRNNHDEGQMTTTLLDGSIRYIDENANVNVVLKPDEELVFDKNNNQYYLKQISYVSDVPRWIDGKLAFENASLAEIAISLERNYNVRIHFADEEVKHQRFNAEFETADNIYQILSILEITDKFTYRVNNRDIILSSK